MEIQVVMTAGENRKTEMMIKTEEGDKLSTFFRMVLEFMNGERVWANPELIVESGRVLPRMEYLAHEVANFAKQPEELTRESEAVVLPEKMSFLEPNITAMKEAFENAAKKKKSAATAEAKTNKVVIDDGKNAATYITKAYDPLPPMTPRPDAIKEEGLYSYWGYKRINDLVQEASEMENPHYAGIKFDPNGTPRFRARVVCHCGETRKEYVYAHAKDVTCFMCGTTIPLRFAGTLPDKPKDDFNNFFVQA